MCRFSGPHDPEYAKVAAALHRIYNASQQARVEKAQSRQTRNSAFAGLSESEKPTRQFFLQDLTKSLTFAQIDSRYYMVERAHTKTCRWLLDNPEYLNWANAELSSENNFLWIKGKPGAGKSTIMKFAVSEAKNRRNGTTILHFFFNARGSELERSTLGLYRSILLQLLQASSDGQPILNTDITDSELSSAHEWTLQRLKELFGMAVVNYHSRPIVCYIDALDECEEDDVRDMISYLLSLGEDASSAGVHLRVLFSSRHYPHITIKKGLSLILEGQEEHDQDITNYIESELAVGDGDYAAALRQKLQNKASGVFMWVVLVVRILNKEYDRGNIISLERRLDEIPSDLYGLFENIISRDYENLEQLWLCIQWVLFAKRPLTREELYFAIISGSDEPNLTPWDRKRISVPDMGRYILNCSKGLTEVTKKARTIQFIHESVRDFFIKENGMGRLWPQFRGNFRGMSHDKLKECCEAQLCAVPGADSLSRDTHPTHPDKTAMDLKAFPFLDYAVNNVFYHANIAQGQNFDQRVFISSFDRSRWIVLSNTLEQYPIRRYTRNADMLYILAARNAEYLLQIHPNLHSHYNTPYQDERCRLPLYVALSLDHIEAARVLLSHPVTHDSCTCGLVTPAPSTYEGPPCLRYGREFGFHDEEEVLQRIIELEDVAVLHAFL
ncbi:hypothetical protein GQ53DRAFT_718515, partial [Thozetella sp. PMI_491]